MEKTAHYRRVVWAAPGRSLEQLIRRALRQCPDVASTKFAYRTDTAAQVTERSVTRGPVGCYFTLFNEGDPAAVVENGGSRLGRVRAPNGREFIRTGVYLMVEENHLGYVAEGQTNDGQIAGLLYTFLRHLDFPSEELQFHIMPRANLASVRRLLEVGVKEIDIGITAFQVEAEEINAGLPRPLWAQAQRAAATSVRQVFGADRSIAEIEAASQIEAKLSFSFDGRSAGELTAQMMSALARSVLDTADDEFRIVTKDDEVITRDKLMIKRPINVVGDRISLEVASVFGALRESLREWRERGVFAE